jgi:Prolyl oligopeptidase family
MQRFGTRRCAGLALVAWWLSHQEGPQLNAALAEAGGAAATLQEVVRDERLKNPQADYSPIQGYPEGSTYVYRSEVRDIPNSEPDVRSALVVFADRKYANADEAFAAMKAMGLTDIADGDRGSVFLVSPAGNAWGQADFDAYRKLDRILFSASRVFGPLGAPYANGASGLFYAVGIGSGADFFNTYVATSQDHAGKIAAALLVGPHATQAVPAVVEPVFLVDADPSVVSTYVTALGSTDKKTQGHATIYTNTLPTMDSHRVITTQTAGRSLKDVLAEGYDKLLRRTQRVAMGINRDYQGDSAPFALWTRSTFDEQDITRTVHQNESFPGQNGIRGWTEYVPNAMKNASPRSYALLIAQNFVVGSGWTQIAAAEKLIIVVPGGGPQGGVARGRGGQAPAGAAGGRGGQGGALPTGAPPTGGLGGPSQGDPPTGQANFDETIKLLDYIVSKYQQIDPSRVYATGFSVGGIATNYLGLSNPSKFAALAPTGAVTGPNVRLTQLTKAVAKNNGKYKMPIFMLTDSQDSTYGPTYRRFYSTWDGDASRTIAKPFYDQFHIFNSMDVLADEAVDFHRYEYFGVPLRYWGNRACGDLSLKIGYEFDKNNVPMLEFAVGERSIHNVYPCYAIHAWNFLSQFSRDQTTGAVIYKPNGTVH